MTLSDLQVYFDHYISISNAVFCAVMQQSIITAADGDVGFSCCYK